MKVRQGRVGILQVMGIKSAFNGPWHEGLDSIRLRVGGIPSDPEPNQNDDRQKIVKTWDSSS